MDRRIVAPPLTLAYVIKGFWTSPAIEAQYDGGTLYEKLIEDGGELGVMNELIDRAALVEYAWITLPEDLEFLGVWDYEVSEPFGEFLASYAHHHGELPDVPTCNLFIQTLIVEPK